MSTAEDRWKRMDDAARFASIVQSSPDAIVAKTLDGVITDWNPAAERIYGWSAAEAIGRTIDLILIPGQRPEVDEILRRVATGETVRDVHTTRRHKDGHVIRVNLTEAPLYNRFGQLVGASVVACHAKDEELRLAVVDRLDTIVAVGADGDRGSDAERLALVLAELNALRDELRN